MITKKKTNEIACRTAIIALSVSIPSVVHAATYIDDFSSDTIANYNNSNTNMSINTTGGYAIIDGGGDYFNNIAQLEAGEYAETVVLSTGTKKEIRFVVSSEPDNPDQVTDGDGIRFLFEVSTARGDIFRDGSQVNTTTDRVIFTGPTANDFANDITLRLYRDTNTDFRLQFIGTDTNFTSDTISLAEVATDDGLYLGYETFGSGTRHIDYLQIAAIPEPSSAALLGLGGLSLVLRRRR